MKEYIALFFTHSGAIKFERFVKGKNIKFLLMPVPRKLSSSCGVGVRFEFNNSINEILIDEIESLYEIEENNYKRIYVSE